MATKDMAGNCGGASKVAARGVPSALLMAMAVVVVLTMLGGCRPLVRYRTLPPSIRTVYVPMAINRSAEPGIEERITVAVQREFLADGRLDVVQERRADALVKLTIREFNRKTGGLDSDDFATGGLYEIITDIEVVENIPGRPLVGTVRKVTTKFGYNADTRSVAFMPEPDRQNDFSEEVARQVVMEVLTGEIDKLLLKGVDDPDAPAGTKTAPAK